jgi:hypothetical protein
MTMSLKVEGIQLLSWSFELPIKERNLVNIKNMNFTIKTVKFKSLISE